MRELPAPECCRFRSVVGYRGICTSDPGTRTLNTYPNLKSHTRVPESKLIISRQALAREGDYEMMPVCACVRALVSHADSSKTTTATDFL